MQLREYISDRLKFKKSVERFQSYRTICTPKLGPYFDRGPKKFQLGLCVIFILWRSIYKRYQILIINKYYFTVNWISVLIIIMEN